MSKYNFSFYVGGIKETCPQSNSMTLKEVNRLVRSTNYVDKVKAIRNGEKALKSTLDYITPAGTFQTRNNAQLIKRSGVFCLDFDHVSDMRTLKANLLKQLPPALFFDSPSGNGLKVFYYIDIEAAEHIDYFKAFQNFFRSEMNLEIDKQCSDISRACFLSWDNNSYLNEDAEIVGKDFMDKHKPTEKTIQQSAKIETSINTTADFDKCESMRKYLEKSESFTTGNRNHFVGLLCAALNRVGVPKNSALNYLFQYEQPDFKAKEIRGIVDCSYKQANLHGCNPLKDSVNSTTIAKSANIANSNNQEVDIKDQQLLNMPFLPDDIFQQLPVILKNGCNVFPDRRKRDVFLTGALSILSGCMPNVVSLYNGEQNKANLYSFVVAPAATGKGALASAKALGNKYHRKLVDESEARKKQYNLEMQAYKKSLASGKNNAQEMEMPEEPPYKVLYIPANNSSARVIQHLKEGDQQGIFCETEADSMGNVMKQDWGGYSDLLRKAFHHEPISYSRKTNKEYVEINKPCLSVALAGTPGQVVNLIKSSEDGLFSRFLFYTFKSENTWIRASETSNGVNLTKHFDELSDSVLSFVEFLNYQNEIYVRLTEEQWNKLNEFGENSLITLSCFFSEDLGSTSKRLGLILLRLCMILTALRYFDSAETCTEFLCSDLDFDIALQIVKVYEQHAVFMFNELPKSSKGADKALKKFHEILPSSFQRKEAIELADKQLQIKERTADSYLVKLLSAKLLDNPRSGFYKKIQK